MGVEKRCEFPFALTAGPAAAVRDLRGREFPRESEAKRKKESLKDRHTGVSVCVFAGPKPHHHVAANTRELAKFCSSSSREAPPRGESRPGPGLESVVPPVPDCVTWVAAVDGFRLGWPHPVCRKPAADSSSFP